MSAEQIRSYADHVNDKDYQFYGLGYKLLSAGMRKSFTLFPAQN